MDFDHLTVNLCVCNTVYNTLCLINKKVSKSNERIMDRDASKPQPIENEKGSKKTIKFKRTSFSFCERRGRLYLKISVLRC